MRLSYAEQNFILAEGAVRGWISEDASTYYKKGIEASMNFIADNTPDKEEYTHGRTITQEYIQEYLAQPVIQLSGDKEKDLEMILLQRYLASFLQHPYDAYYDYRRTGYPVLPINPNTNLNTEKIRFLQDGCIRKLSSVTILIMPTKLFSVSTMVRTM